MGRNQPDKFPASLAPVALFSEEKNSQHIITVVFFVIATYSASYASHLRSWRGPLALGTCQNFNYVPLFDLLRNVNHLAVLLLWALL